MIIGSSIADTQHIFFLIVLSKIVYIQQMNSRYVCILHTRFLIILDFQSHCNVLSNVTNLSVWVEQETQNKTMSEIEVLQPIQNKDSDQSENEPPGKVNPHIF
jgi:hypothetical protein